MRLPIIAALFAMTCAASAQDPPARFSGAAGLQAATPASADGRFSVQATMRPADPVRYGGRFALDAKLTPDFLASSATTACTAAGVTIFGNGFEN